MPSAWSRRMRPIALWRRIKVWFMALIKRPSQLCTPIQRIEIEHDIHEQARLSTYYYLMLFCACGIATLGLLQSSVAVLIGAMLISPLMTPIMAMGLALARLNFAAFKTALLTLTIGVLLSIFAGMLIVWISPLKEATPEILSRTRPTLLDLGVAVLSGVVGAYVTISRKSGAVVGVAIATAILPPLTVVGFGIVTGSAAIAGGAFLLFITNVMAILSAVFFVARRYGFKPIHRPNLRWEAAVIIGAYIVLCTPLALTLSDIVAEARLTNQVRSDIETVFKAETSRISDLRVTVDHGTVRNIQAVVITRNYVPDATTRLRKIYPGLENARIEQVMAANEPKLLPGLRAAVPGGGNASASRSPEEAFLAQIFARTARIESLTQDGNRLNIQVVLLNEGGLADYKRLEDSAATLMPDNVVRIVPPRLPLPAIGFEPGGRDLSLSAREAIVLNAWAYQRWGEGAVQVTGYGPPRQLTLARQRAEVVAEALEAEGISVSTAISLMDENADRAVILASPLVTSAP